MDSRESINHAHKTQKKANFMRFLCLAAIYTHSQEWLENLVQCFIDQTHREATLLILDDRPNEFRYQDPCRFIPWSVPNVSSAITTNRGNMAHKYNDGLKLAVDISYDAVCIFDDDDHFLPTHLERHAAVLEKILRVLKNVIGKIFQRVVLRIDRPDDFVHGLDNLAGGACDVANEWLVAVAH